MYPIKCQILRNWELKFSKLGSILAYVEAKLFYFVSTKVFSLEHVDSSHSSLELILVSYDNQLFICNVWIIPGKKDALLI